jgi:hypothetical protein
MRYPTRSRVSAADRDRRRDDSRAGRLRGIGSSAGSDPNNPDQVEAITWWTSGTEKTALYDMVAVFKQENPSLEFIDASVSGGGGEKARRRSRRASDRTTRPTRSSRRGRGTLRLRRPGQAPGPHGRSTPQHGSPTSTGRRCSSS